MKLEPRGRAQGGIAATCSDDKPGADVARPGGHGYAHTWCRPGLCRVDSRPSLHECARVLSRVQQDLLRGGMVEGHHGQPVRGRLRQVAMFGLLALHELVEPGEL